MRGLRAKKLRELAKVYVLKQEKKPLNTGYNEYRYIENRIDWEAQLDDKGYPLMDPEGLPLMKTTKVPGTCFTAYLFRMVYQRLKKAHYARVLRG